MAVVPYLTHVIENLKSLLKNEVALLWGVESDTKKLSSTLSTIHAILEDAEQKQLKDKAMQNWLKELNDAAYEADDILDECAFEALRCESEGQGSSSASLKRKLLSYLPTTYASPNILFRHSIGNRIKEITDKFDAIVANRRKFHLNERLVVEKRVEYDRVIKATIESANGNAWEAVDLDSLQRKLCDMLNGKRYLIVLDDVWDEDPDKWDALKQQAFGRGNEEHPNLVAIGKEIVKKCGGVPIAAKALGGLMRFKSQEKEWLHGSAISKEELIHLSMANGYISCKGGWEPEDIGDQICNELCLISFFQEDESEMIVLNSSSNISKEKVHYVTLVAGHADNFNNTVHKIVSLRTLRLQHPPTFPLEDDEFLCDFRKFGSLRAFDAGGRHMTESPSSIGNSKHLSLLAELKCLNLGGELRIRHLERVSNSMDAKEANLVGKQNLSQLQLNWEYGFGECESQENVDSEAQGEVESGTQTNVKSELVLEALKPHPNLKELVVSGYKVEYIENEYPCGGGFPSLEEDVYNCPKLEGLSREEGRELFPRLRKIEIGDCPKLSFSHLSSPKELLFECECTMILNSISNLNSLTSLAIVGDEETVCFPKEFLRNLTLIESLVIQNYEGLKVLPGDLASLVTLKIKGCPKLESLPEEGLRGFESLQSLEICSYRNIASLPVSIQSLTKLQSLDIQFCDELERQCEERKGEDWYKIAHISQVTFTAVCDSSFARCIISWFTVVTHYIK
ncbi:hypothetical protein ACSBR1_037957 [Camellia fascicularis]